MKNAASRKPKAPSQEWPRKVTVGFKTVSVYRRKTPQGNFAFMVGNYAEGRRRFDSYATEELAMSAAETLATRLAKRHVVAATLTDRQAKEYLAAVEVLPVNVRVPDAASDYAKAVKRLPEGVDLVDAASVVAAAMAEGVALKDIPEACKFFVTRNRQIERKAVAAVVKELLKVKKARGSSKRYVGDLKSRLGRFARDCRKDACNVTTADVQAWLDSQKLAPQSYVNFRRVLSLLFGFAKSRGYTAENPVDGCERVKAGNGDAIEIYTPSELARLLSAASADFLPALAIGAFCGLRSAELARLHWQDVDFEGGHIVVTAKAAKTASRRLIPIPANLAQWLAPYKGSKGRVWPLTERKLYTRMQETAAATAVTADREKGIKAQPPLAWKHNALRHSFISYRLAETKDAAKVALEAGNSVAMIFRHYRELVKPADAVNWFSVSPETPGNVLQIPATAAANR